MDAHAGTSTSSIADEGLSDIELRVLAFEHRRWRNAGTREQAIVDEFGMSPVRFHQLLNALVDKPAALVADPMLVKRLRRLRETRRQLRTA